uniref:Uncharacterized protein LOC100184970 n=1 Tax=Phallusia mammillata TaxID=59560 RepID=A0A6F9DIW5_9ASCI|nr:uncharacterized protein LOC100184970 [Phallusia mammillata]
MSCVTAVNNLVSNCSHSVYTPTNQASSICSRHASSSMKDKQEQATLPLFTATDLMPIWLPVSKGDIKKTAQTRFVNSSPKSYRLMPASVESSEADKTSFVEKSSHKFLLPVSYFLEVAKLWALSNRSELECQFTQAKTDSQFEPTSSTKDDPNEESRRPICHAKAVTDITSCPWSVGDLKSPTNTCATTAEQDLLSSINRFLDGCRKKDTCMSGGTDLSEMSSKVGSETRRYLSQVMSLMSKKFAFKLVKQQNGLSKAFEREESRKRTVCDKLKNCKVVKEPETQQVNVFKMSTCDQEESNNDQLFIIHIPTSHINSEKTNDCNHQPDQGPNSKRTRKNSNDSSLSEQDMDFSRTVVTNNPSENYEVLNEYNCFYCSEAFNDQPSCARHMLSHLSSGINCG